MDKFIGQLSQEEHLNLHWLNGNEGLIHEQETAIIQEENIVKKVAAEDIARDILENFENMNDKEQSDAINAYEENFK